MFLGLTQTCQDLLPPRAGKEHARHDSDFWNRWARTALGVLARRIGRPIDFGAFITEKTKRAFGTSPFIVFVFFENGFPKDHSKAVRSYKFLLEKPELFIPIEVPARAEFAVKGFHDEHMDAMATKNWTGYIPKEGLDFSAGVTILGGALTFQ